MDAGLSSFISLFGGWKSSEMAGQQAELSLVRSTNACDMVIEGHYIAIPWHIRSLPARAPVGPWPGRMDQAPRRVDRHVTAPKTERQVIDLGQGRITGGR